MSNYESLMGPADISDELGYRPPYQMLDRVAKVDGAWVGTKCATAGSPYFQGHFPDQPILPGVLQVEAMFQLAVLICRKQGMTGLPVLRGLDNVKFRRPIMPGFRMMTYVSVTKEEQGFKAVSTVECDGTVASQAKLTFEFVDGTEELTPKEFLPKYEGAPFEHVVETAEIMQAIPHRYPFLMIDRVMGFSENFQATDPIRALRSVSADEQRSLAWYGNHAFLPATMLTEILAQVGCVARLLNPENRGKLVYFVAVDRARFTRSILPGDELVIEGQLVSLRERYGKGVGRVLVGSEVVAETDVKFAMAESSK
ncbi:MAG TPA: hypothetical protein DCR55_03340 [Lentisphaeria bacterium]|nr:hypothetical protein [Lentisphaeria bacterium]